MFAQDAPQAGRCWLTCAIDRVSTMRVNQMPRGRREMVWSGWSAELQSCGSTKRRWMGGLVEEQDDQASGRWKDQNLRQSFSHRPGSVELTWWPWCAECAAIGVWQDTIGLW